MPSGGTIYIISILPLNDFQECPLLAASINTRHKINQKNVRYSFTVYFLVVIPDKFDKSDIICNMHMMYINAACNLLQFMRIIILKNCILTVNTRLESVIYSGVMTSISLVGIIRI